MYEETFSKDWANFRKFDQVTKFTKIVADEKFPFYSILHSRFLFYIP